MRVDLLDKKIINILYEDARMPYNTIAKALKVNKNTINYRISRLRKNNIIQNCSPVLDFDKLGSNVYEIFLKTKNDEKIIIKLQNFLKLNDHILWSSKIIGEWDYHFEVCFKELKHFRAFFNDFLIQFKDIIENYDIFSIYRFKAVHQLYDLKSKVPTKVVKKIEYKPDLTDHKILTFLATKDGFASYSEIGKSLELSLETVRNHVLKLKNSGIILRFIPFIQPKSVGLEDYLLIIKYNPGQILKPLFLYLNDNYRIILGLQNLNNPEIMCLLFVENFRELEKIIEEIKTNFKDSVKSVANLFISEELVLNFYPKQTY